MTRFLSPLLPALEKQGHNDCDQPFQACATPCSTPFPWRHAESLCKGAAEMALVIEAAIERDVSKGQIGRKEQLLRTLKSGTDQPLVRRSEEHTSELPSLMRISYAVFCLKKKKIRKIIIDE